MSRIEYELPRWDVGRLRSARELRNVAQMPDRPVPAQKWGD